MPSTALVRQLGKAITLEKYPYPSKFRGFLDHGMKRSFFRGYYYAQLENLGHRGYSEE